MKKIEDTSYIPVSSEDISAEEYLELRKGGFRNVREVKIKIPKLGSKNFGGGFSVSYDYPELKAS